MYKTYRNVMCVYLFGKRIFILIEKKTTGLERNYHQQIKINKVNIFKQANSQLYSSHITLFSILSLATNV